MKPTPCPVCRRVYRDVANRMAIAADGQCSICTAEEDEYDENGYPRD